MTVTIHTGDCRELLRALVDNSVDAVVTDPPYELGFMGKSWDRSGVAFDVELWREVLRVAKPGAHLLAFGGSRTYHRMACAIEDAGWEMRDQIMWIYGSGFPKSRNGPWGGTALKPAHEPIVMARKPPVGTVAANVIAHGTGALNIDGCRIAGGEISSAGGTRRSGGIMGVSEPLGGWEPSHAGRWPANIIHDGSEEVLAAFPDAPGQAAAVTGDEPSANGFSGAVTFGGMIGRVASRMPRGDAGSAARFFYCAKASKRDREDGCSDLPTKPGGMVSNTSGQHIMRRDGAAPGPAANHHPTVKPTNLMRYLCRLVTPPGGLILDPFTGSGSTGRGAVLEGFRFIGCELSPEYSAIATARIEAACQHAEAERIEREDAQRQGRLIA